MERSNTINRYSTAKDPTLSLWMEQLSNQLSSAQSVVRTCLGWVFELGITQDMPFYVKKNLAMINAVAFVSLLFALPGTFMLILMGFNHPFSLLISGVLAACLILGFNAARHVEWSKALFAFTPALIILIYTLIELSPGRLAQSLNYLLARQGLCFALLIPILIYGYEQTHKVLGVLGVCLLIFLAYGVGSMRLGAFEGEIIPGAKHGLFSVLSLLQYAGLAGCALYIQRYSIQHARQTQQANEKLKSLTIRDGLTGLFNHSFMQELIGDAINRSKRSKNPLALLMMDVDFFKQINDTLGHNAGDDVLIKLTRLLKSNKRSTDYLGRWGGDELVLLLTDTNLAGANNLAEKLSSLVATQAFPNGKQLTISVGASEYQDGDSPASFVAHADAAMYRAKRAGRNRVVNETAAPAIQSE